MTKESPGRDLGGDVCTAHCPSHPAGGDTRELGTHGGGATGFLEEVSLYFTHSKVRRLRRGVWGVPRATFSNVSSHGHWTLPSDWGGVLFRAAASGDIL